MAAKKRSYGAGSLYVHTDVAGRELYYGRWRRDGQQLNGCLGPKRKGKLGLTPRKRRPSFCA